jgi:hypothetical protein
LGSHQESITQAPNHPPQPHPAPRIKLLPSHHRYVGNQI